MYSSWRKTTEDCRWGGAFIILYPKCFQIEDDSLLFDLTVNSSFPIQCSQCLKQQWFTFKVTLEVTVSSEAGLCVRWKWLLLPWSLDKFCYKLEAVCMHSALMAGWSAGWWGGDSSEQQQSPQALLFCLTLSRTHTTWCPHRARLCTRGCVCVCVCQQEASFRRSLAENETFPTMHWDDESITNVSRVCVCRSDEEMVKFMQLMHSIWNICGKDVVTAFDLSPFKVICDLGGKFSSDFHKSVQVCLNWAAAGSAAHLQCTHLWSPHTFWVKDFIYLLVTMSWIW